MITAFAIAMLAGLAAFGLTAALETIAGRVESHVWSPPALAGATVAGCLTSGVVAVIMMALGRLA